MADEMVPDVVVPAEKPKLRKKRGGRGFTVATPRPKRPVVESVVQAQAFEYYYSLGPTRTAQQVAEKFSFTINQVERMSRNFRWVARCQEREKEVAARLRYETEDETINRRRNILKIIDYCIESKLIRNEEGKIIGVDGITFKNVAEMTQFLELAERILHPGGMIAATQKQNGKEKNDGGTKILINITK